jgi:hypothetical protein
MIVVIMSSDQQVPGNSEPEPQDVVAHADENPEGDHTTWISRHSRGLWGVGVVSAAVIIGVTMRALFSKKD